jgi:thiol-disulfide isomerase/thioredoxin
VRLWLLLLAALPAWPQACQPDSFMRSVLEKLQTPEDLRLPAAQRQQEKIAVLRQALARSPKNLFLHEAYQRVRIAGLESNRESVIAEYEKLLSANPQDPLLLYLAASAQAGRKTKDAITNLERAVTLAPSFAQPHLRLAEIYSHKDFRNDALVAQHADRFAGLCPSSIQSFPVLSASKNRDLIARNAARLRTNLSNRTDSEALGAYPALWRLEAALQQPGQQAEIVKRMHADVDQLFTPEFPRNQAWLSTLRTASFLQDGFGDAPKRAQREVAAAYPHSDAAWRQALAQARGDDSYPESDDPEQVRAFWHRYWQATLPLAQKFPGSQELAGELAEGAIRDTSSTSQEVNQALALYRKALANDPDGFSTLPPWPIEVAGFLAERGIAFEQIPDLVFAGFTAIERRYGASNYSDVSLSGATPQDLKQARNMFYLFAYVPLAEAYVRLNRLDGARDVLLQIQEKLSSIRPQETASGAKKSRYAEVEAQYWFLQGLYAEKAGRKLDALVDYRNSIATYPPRRPNPDRRDEVMVSAQRLWKELGGTLEGWNDWAAHSSLTSFNAGSGTSNAWAKLSSASPTPEFTDSLGHHWSAQDLAKKTTFVTLWASWCPPCRAELPYVEKLYHHFQNRSDIAILALNVDDDPALMTKALTELNVSVPSVAARDIAYQMLPTMAIPANWLITPRETRMMFGDSGTLDQWLAETTNAIENAAKR